MPLAFTGGAPFVVLAPHPDDESLGVGGLIAAACAAGHGVRVVILTDGAGSHPRSMTYKAPRLAALRKAEAAAAVARLGLPAEHLTHLDLPDTLAPTEGVAFETAVERIVQIVRDADARRLLVTWDRDPHCDHEAAAAMALAVRHRVPALELWAYPIWGLHLARDTPLDDAPPTGFRIDIAAWRDAKRGAIAAYASQMTDLIADDPTGFRFNEAKLAPFLTATEIVFAVRG